MVAAGQSNSAGTSLPAKVGAVTYLGHMHQYTCSLSGGQNWRVSAVGSVAPCREGQDVNLAIDPQHVVLLTK